MNTIDRSTGADPASFPNSRRKFIGLLTAVAATATLSTNRAATYPPGWKVAMGLNGFQSSGNKYEKTFPIWEVANFGAREGFDGVELVSDWPMGGYPDAGEKERIAALKRFWDGFGLRIFSIQLGADGAFNGESEVRSRWLETFKNRIKLARQLGCECVGMWPYGSLGKQSLEEGIENLGRSLRAAAAFAQEYEILTAFEVEPPFVFNTEKSIRDILAAADHPNLKTIFDPSHFDIMSGSRGKPHEMLERVGVKNIGYVHFTDCDGTLRDGGTSKHLAAGDGHIDIPASLAMLREGGFRGWIMIDEWEIPDPYDACVKGIKAIRQAWH